MIRVKRCPCGKPLTWWDRRFLFLLQGRWCKNCRFRMSIGMLPRRPDWSEPDVADKVVAEANEELDRLLMNPAKVVIEHSCALPPLKWPSRYRCPECGLWWSCVPREGGARWMKEARPVSVDREDEEHARMLGRYASASVLASQGTTWDLKQRAAAPGFFYGDGGTIHGTTHLDVEVDVNGEVVAVWYRCRQLPFVQVFVNNQRAEEMRAVREEDALPKLTGVHLLDP